MRRRHQCIYIYIERERERDTLRKKEHYRKMPQGRGQIILMDPQHFKQTGIAYRLHRLLRHTIFACTPNVLVEMDVSPHEGADARWVAKDADKGPMRHFRRHRKHQAI